MPKRRRKRRTVLRDGPDPIDIHVGESVRERRVYLGMTQTDLGEYLRLTFQQIQKYERGANRISASKLWALSHLFDVPIEWFFYGLGEPSQEREDVMTKLEARQLARYYQACPPPIRDRLRALIRATADMSGKNR
jgi:transcriptional regulator with XRE-family HTH domain